MLWQYAIECLAPYAMFGKLLNNQNHTHFVIASDFEGIAFVLKVQLNAGYS